MDTLISDLTFGWFDGLEPRGEELVEAEILDIRREIPDPDAVILFPGHQPGRVVIELVADRLKRKQK